ncbi:MAG: hypothetical protein PHR43_01235 [Dehalococcoidales bacterium]|nr:hypothetical protein [Dehalococcoidales bacterium]
MDNLLTPEENQLIGDFGIAFEHSGLSRMAGRIIGWLLLAEPPYQSAEQLANVLQASRGSISTSTRLLIQVGLVEQFSQPGMRQRYFRLDADFWQNIATHSVKEFTIFHRLAERSLKLVTDRKPHARQWLEDMHEIYSFLEKELPAMVLRWEQEHYMKNDNKVNPSVEAIK